MKLFPDYSKVTENLVYNYCLQISSLLPLLNTFPINFHSCDVPKTALAQFNGNLSVSIRLYLPVFDRAMITLTSYEHCLLLASRTPTLIFGFILFYYLPGGSFFLCSLDFFFIIALSSKSSSSQGWGRRVSHWTSLYLYLFPTSSIFIPLISNMHHGFEYHLYVDGSQIPTSRLDLVLESQTCTATSWLL